MFAITKLLDSTASAGRVGRRPVFAVSAAGAVLVALGLAAWLAWRPAQAAPRVARTPSVDAGEPALALVFVSGAVVHPGLYRLSPSARIADALAAAGGLAPDADSGHLPNLAGPVHEGKQINVPFRRSTTSRSLASRLDINTATPDELSAIPTMPVGLAEAIVDYRAHFGAFRTLSELRTMLGVDGPTVTGLRPYLYVAPVSP
jgi:competence protein ComEA